jgi:protein-L-isoaspartate(D-aspartate) O-methyltransferase
MAMPIIGITCGWSLLNEGAVEGKRCLLFESNDRDRLAQGLQATAIDGTKIGSLQLKVQYKIEATKTGAESHEQPALIVHFYDDNRRLFESIVIGPWIGTTDDWRPVSKSITVPPKSREMIVRIGLNGGTGKLWLDDLQLTPKPR